MSPWSVRFLTVTLSSVFFFSAKEVQSGNIARESKLYSYKEQMEELALRKELEAKRAREGRAGPEKLTPKQKEAIANQLDKESKIRSRVAEVRSACLAHGRP